MLVLVCATTAGVAWAQAAGPEPAGVRVWIGDITVDTPAANPSDTRQTVTIAAVRNGTFSGMAVVESADTITNLRASVGPLSTPGETIPADNVRLRYAVALPWAKTWRGPRRTGADTLLESPPAEVPAAQGRALLPVWVTVKVPKDAKPGVYEGSLKIEAKRLPAQAVPIELTVADWALPDTQDYHIWTELVQSPDTLAVEYGVPLWSPKHWELIARSFRLISETGSRVVHIPLLCGTNFGNAESMVRWVKKAGGGDNEYEYDFSVMDKYLDLAEKHLGKPKLVIFPVWDAYLNLGSQRASILNEEHRTARQSLRGKGPRVTVMDPMTGKTETEYLPLYEDPASGARWKPLFAELRQRMAKRGLEQTMALGTMSDVRPSKEQVAFLYEASGGVPWASYAHHGPRAGRKIHNVAEVAYITTVWDAVWVINPANGGRLYGWRGPQLGSYFFRAGPPPWVWVRNLPLLSITGNQRGVGRMGADFWPAIRDNKGRRAGMVYQRYPENQWRNLDIESWLLAPGPEGALCTARYENLREGVQECEVRIFLERTLLDPDKKSRLGPEFSRRCQEVLDEHHRAMSKSFGATDEMLEMLDKTAFNNPHEALWRALVKKGKSLPSGAERAAFFAHMGMAAEGKDKPYERWRDKVRTWTKWVKDGRQWWSASSGWQASTAKLFAMASEVEKRAPARP